MTRIRRLAVHNLRSLRSLDAPDLSPSMNLIVGANGAGKSTFKDSLSLLFTGTCTGHETGMNLAALRSRDGSADKPWMIEATLDIDGKDDTIVRTDSEGPKSNRQALVETMTRVSGAKAAACIRAGEFLRLDAKARQRFLMDLAPRETLELPETTAAAIALHLGQKHTTADLVTLEALHKLAYDERTVAGRVVRELGDAAAPAVPEGFEVLDGKPLADVAAGREQYRAKVRELTAERDRELTAATARSVDLKPYENAERAAKDRLTVAERALTAHATLDVLDAKAKAVMEKLKGAGETNVALEARRHELNDQIGVAEGSLKRARAVLAALDAEKGDVGKCPVCESKLAKTARGLLEGKLKRQGDTAAMELQRAKGDLETLPPLVSIAKLEEEMDRLRVAEERRGELEANVKTAVMEHAQALLALHDAQARPVEGGDAAAAGRAEALAARIAEGNRRADVLAEYHGKLDAHVGAVGKRAAALARHDALTALVEQLGPGGLRKALGSGGALKLHEDLNAVLSPLGFEVDLRPVLDAEGEPLVRIEGGPWIPAREGALSDSQLIRFYGAFAVAVATYTGLGIVVVDRFESLDRPARDGLWSLLRESGHQVFVLAVQTDPDFAAKAARVNAGHGDAVRYFVLEDGVLVAPREEAA